MPVMTRQLPPEQIWAVIAFLESQGGTVDVTGADIEAAKQPAAAPSGAAFAGGSTDAKTIIQAAGCLVCHKLDGQGQTIAPDLTHVGSRRDAESIRKKVLDRTSSIAKGYEKLAGIMPKMFGTMMNASQLEALAQYLAAHKCPSRRSCGATRGTRSGRRSSSWRWPTSSSCTASRSCRGAPSSRRAPGWSTWGRCSLARCFMSATTRNGGAASSSRTGARPLTPP